MSDYPHNGLLEAPSMNLSQIRSIRERRDRAELSLLLEGLDLKPSSTPTSPTLVSTASTPLSPPLSPLSARPGQKFPRNWPAFTSSHVYQELQNLYNLLPPDSTRMIGSLGDLHLVDTLTLRRLNSDVMTLYLFDEALLCVRKPKKKMFSKKTTLELRGRVLWKDIKRVFDSSIASELSLTIEMHNNHEPFAIIFPLRHTLETWLSTINMTLANFTPGISESPLSTYSFSNSSATKVASSSSSTTSSVKRDTIQSTLLSTQRNPPRGAEMLISRIQTYISTPVDSKSKRHRQKAVVLVPDISGWRAAPIRRIADAFAEMGYLVFVPDIFDGDVNQLEKPNAWAEADEFAARHSVEKVQNAVDLVIDAARFGVKAGGVAVVGYGYGAQFAMLANETEQANVIVAVTPTSFAIGAEHFLRMAKPMLTILSPDTASTDMMRRCRSQITSNNTLSKFSTFTGTTRRFALHSLTEEDRVAAMYALEDTICYIEDHILSRDMLEM